MFQIRENIMSIFDVVIIGAGPAGCQCARELSAANKKVLVIEKSKDFHTNNFSSGGAPMSMMRDFLLPDSIVGTHWNSLMIATSNDQHTWKGKNFSGVVCDFMKLRTFLIDEAKKFRTELRLYTTYIGHEKKQNNVTRIYLKNLDTHKDEIVETKVLVDATGVERKVLMDGDLPDKGTITATGIEYLMEVPAEDYQKYQKQLNFYFGLRWMPQGYAWIFPMEKNLVKVGVIRYFPHEKIVPYENSYHHYLDLFIQRHLTPPFKILDKHGKTLFYLTGQKDLKSKDNVIAIGDAISTLNPLACEGIRHALFSGKIAAKHILDYLGETASSFKEYEKEIKRYCGYRWKISEALMNAIYKQKNDKNYDSMLQTFKSFTMDEILDFSFNYKLTKILKLYFHYGWLRLKQRFGF